MIEPAAVHATLRRNILVDGYEFVLDTRHSRGCELVDARTGDRYLDMFSFYASNPLGMNHPRLADDPTYRNVLAEVALNKPTNSGVYTTHFAEFVATFDRVVGDPQLPHRFFIEGGALAVENALKVAFDWKSRCNEAAGRSGELGTQVLHLTKAFHGRSGYTMSLTNSAAVKVARYPKFRWPRIPVPAVTFPLERHRFEIEAAESTALAAARSAFAAAPHDIACFIFEPIQGEGGDNHLRPEFLRAMQDLCTEHEALFIADEVQTGCGLTGTPWAYSALGLEPDVVAFGKKFQVCGLMAGRRVDDVADNVFAVSGRINSTFGGNLADMVRARRILEVIETESIFDRVAPLGEILVAGLSEVQSRYPQRLSNARGRGLMCAVDLPDPQVRDDVVRRLAREERVLVLPSGERAIRFRPTLTVGEDELERACDALRRVISREGAGR
jgi:L-lysine 6-transaminase